MVEVVRPHYRNVDWSLSLCQTIFTMCVGAQILSDSVTRYTPNKIKLKSHPTSVSDTCTFVDVCVCVCFRYQDTYTSMRTIVMYGV